MSENKPRRRAQAARAAKKSASRKSGLSRVMLVAMMMVMVAVLSIGGTLAWLQDNTDPIVNTFTTSDINIELEETDTKKDTDEDPMTNSYQMIPGHTITKDPKVTVKENSEAVYLFVKLEKSANFDDFMKYDMADGWTELTGESGVYYREVAASEAEQEFQVIKDNTVTVLNTVKKEMMDAIEEGRATKPTLTVTAYATQLYADASQNKLNVNDAWNLFKPAEPDIDQGGSAN